VRTLGTFIYGKQALATAMPSIWHVQRLHNFDILQAGDSLGASCIGAAIAAAALIFSDADCHRR
jgi:hypothetical protein